MINTYREVVFIHLPLQAARECIIGALMKKNKYISIFFILCLLVNSMAGFAFSSAPQAAETNDTASLSGILGEKVIICTNSNSGKFFYSSFERLEQEKKQKIKSFAEIEKNHNLKFDNNDKSTTSSDYFTANTCKSKYGVGINNKLVLTPEFRSSISAQGPPSVS